jgi:acyl-CoA synthetase (AMP-forming)/AMP-acid ligase II
MDDMEPPATLPAMLAELVRTRPNHPAILTPRESLTYEELDRQTSRIARALLAAGAGKGTRIGLLAPDGVFFITAFLASLRIGALVTPVSTLCAPPELAYILRNSDIQFLLAARLPQPRLRRQAGTSLARPEHANRPASRCRRPLSARRLD